jgi:hypothetical protein
VFSEPKVVIPGTAAGEPTEGSDSVGVKPSGERLPEATPPVVAQPSVAAGTPVELQPKRARDIAGLADHNALGGARKKRKGNKKSG